MDENTKLIKCRKCGGNHLTIKCGKEKKEEIIPKIEELKLYKLLITSRRCYCNHNNLNIHFSNFKFIAMY
jgi:hypothetical protein